MSIRQHAQNIIAAMDPRRLHIILFTTEQCNFRCTYCYEAFKEGAMSYDVVAGTKALLSQRMPELEHLDISWFGGEPLLTKEIVFDISAHIVETAKNVSHLIYGANMTTNGSLLDIQTFRRLVSLGVKLYQISLDGDCELHNRTRKSKGGKGTFDVIWGNLLAIRNDKSANATIMLRIHYSPDTWENLLPLIEEINREFSADSRFAVYFKSIERLGGSNDGSIRLFSEEAKQQVKSVLQSKLRYSRMIYKSALNGQYVCYASKANSFAIRSNGDIAKCTVALYDRRNKVGKLNSDGSITIDRSRFKYWLNGLQTFDPITLACPYTSMRGLTNISVSREELKTIKCADSTRILNQTPSDQVLQ